MSEYLKETNEFWQEYLDQYNSIYDLDTLNEIIKRHDTTAFLHPQDLAYFKKILVKILAIFQDLKS